MEDAGLPNAELEQQPPALSDQEALAILVRAQQDPFMAEALLKLQRESFEYLENIIRETSNLLPLPESASGSAPAPGAMNSVAALRGQSRQRESVGRQRRELAEALVIGALINQDNPDWDPFDPSTCREPGENLILALLQMQQPGAAAPASGE